MNTAVKNTEVKPASPGQLFEIGNSVGGAVGKLLSERGLTFDQADLLLHEVGKKTINEAGTEIVEKLFSLAPADSMFRYKKDLEKFFLEIYEQPIDLSEVTLKDSWAHFMVNPGNLTSDAIYGKFAKLKLKPSKYISDSIDAMRTGGKSYEPMRATGLYAFGHKGGAEPDTDHLGESYDMFSVDGKSYMTINEYMLVYQFMYWKFKIKLDKKGWTRTSTLGSDGEVVGGGSFVGGFRLGWFYRDRQGLDGGPREVMIF